MARVVRILTYNIWNYSGDWSRRRFVLADTIESAAPDVVALQEVRHNWNDLPGWNQARWLAQRLGYSWTYRPANVFWPLPLVTEGLGFLSREPLPLVRWYSVPHVPRSGPRRIILRANYQGLEMYNVHLPLNEPARLIEVRQLLGLISASQAENVVVLGDFNADATDGPMTTLVDGGLSDLWLTAKPAQGWPRKRRIDYVLAKGDHAKLRSIDAVGADPVAGLLASDHVGILAEIDLDADGRADI